jgi:type IV pilus assembly protein PilO
MNLQDLNNLNLGNAGSWPAAAKASATALLCALVLGAGYWFDTKAQLERLGEAQRQEQDKRAVFEQKQRKAANLEPLRQQLEEMKQSFGAMVRQLPNEAEIEALLVDISQTGLAAGLEFELFEPQPEVARDFYAEKPIKIRVSGTYHEFGEFVSGVSALPRIVTQHDVSLAPRSQKSTELVMEATAKTYRYLEGQSTKAAAKPGQPAGK